MILTKEVEIKLNSSNIKHFKNLGYEIPMKEPCERYKKRGIELVYDLGAPITVKVDDLMKNSSAQIDVLCDMCKEKVIPVKYVNYNKVTDRSGTYVCRECSYIKTQQTLIANYGDLYVNTEEFKEKQKKIFIEKYGVDNPLGNKEIQEKIHRGNIEKYGYKYIGQVPEFKDKMKTTLMEHYGVDSPAKSEEIKEKIRNTNLKRYGFSNAMQSPEIKEKANKTLCENGNQRTSKQQLYLHNLYGGELNYPIKRYSADICFPEEMLYIEYDGGGHNLVVRHGILTQEEFHQKEIARHCIIKREGYKEMRIISSKDLLPCDDILFQMLDEAKQYFFNYPNHSWIEYDIDNSIVRNAEHKDGHHYCFGLLRTIKDNNINNIAKEDEINENDVQWCTHQVP